MATIATIQHFTMDRFFLIGSYDVVCSAAITMFIYNNNLWRRSRKFWFIHLKLSFKYIFSLIQLNWMIEIFLIHFSTASISDLLVSELFVCVREYRHKPIYIGHLDMNRKKRNSVSLHPKPTHYYWYFQWIHSFNRGSEPYIEMQTKLKKKRTRWFVWYLTSAETNTNPYYRRVSNERWIFVYFSPWNVVCYT